MPPWRMVPVLGHKLEEGWREVGERSEPVQRRVTRIVKSLASDISTTSKGHRDAEIQERLSGT